jgi:hypothetical protein
MPDVGSELEGVVALEHPGHIANQLQLTFVFVQRAVAAVDAQPRSEVEPLGPVHESPEQAGGEGVVEIEAEDAGVGGRAAPEIERQNGNLVLEVPKPEVRRHVGASWSNPTRDSVCAPSVPPRVTSAAPPPGRTQSARRA